MYHRQNTKTWKVPSNVGNFTLQGVSRAGDATTFYIPELNWTLDAGATLNQTTDYIFITHGHADHSFMLPYLWKRTGQNICYVPEQLLQFIKNYAISSQQLNNCSLELQPTDPALNMQYIPVLPRQCYTIVKGKVEYKVDIVECEHAVPTVGYCFSEIRKKLKEEYKQLTGKDIGKLAKEGINLYDVIAVPLFVFLGDTTATIFKLHPEILKFPLIIIECTFFTDGQEKAAEESYHIHWNYIKDIVYTNPEVTFVLTHFSLRYKTEEITTFFKNLEENPDKPLKNIVVWI